MSQNAHNIRRGERSCLVGRLALPRVDGDWRFLICKLSLKKRERVVLIGCPDRQIVRQLLECVGSDGRVSLLFDPSQYPISMVEPLQHLARSMPQLILSKPGPTTASQLVDVVIIMPEGGSSPYSSLLEQAWRRLLVKGRLLLILPKGEAYIDPLHKLIEESYQCGFVSRYRRCCDKRNVWIGVKHMR
ncbi:MAG: hypothetical protein R3Y10_11330 [Ferrimonas sp.]